MSTFTHDRPSHLLRRAQIKGSRAQSLAKQGYLGLHLTPCRSRAALTFVWCQYYLDNGLLALTLTLPKAILHWTGVTTSQLRPVNWSHQPRSQASHYRVEGWGWKEHLEMCTVSSPAEIHRLSICLFGPVYCEQPVLVCFCIHGPRIIIFFKNVTRKVTNLKDWLRLRLGNYKKSHQFFNTHPSFAGRRTIQSRMYVARIMHTAQALMCFG